MLWLLATCLPWDTGFSACARPAVLPSPQLGTPGRSVRTSMGVEDVLALTERLKASMGDFRGKFDTWSSAEVAKLEGLKQSQALAVSEAENQMTSLMERKETLESEVGRVEQDGKVARHEVQTMRVELDTLREKMSAKPDALQELKRVYEAESGQLEQAKRECEKMEQEQAAKLAEHSDALEFYSQRLGLELENVDGSFSMVYTAVNPANPDAQHTLCMRVDDATNSYVMDSCVPQLPKLELIAAELNDTNDFGHFVRSVRANFRALYP